MAAHQVPDMVLIRSFIFARNLDSRKGFGHEERANGRSDCTCLDIPWMQV